MNAEVLAEWLQRQGYRVIRTASSYWCEMGPRVYQAFPYHWVIQPTDNELHDLLKRERSIALRFSTPLAAPMGHVSYHVVCSQLSQVSGPSLPKKARYDVKQGLKYATVEPIPLPRMAEEGWALRAETLARQGRSGAESPGWWRRVCLSAEGLPGLEAWGALHDGQLVATLLACTTGDCCGIFYQQSLSAHLRHGVNNALAHVFTLEALRRPGITQIFYGLHSLDAPASVDEFKFRMGYTAKPVRQRVVFHPWIAPVVNQAGYHVIRCIKEWVPGSHTVTKAEGLVRFYLEGKLPLKDQTWPEILREPEEESSDALWRNR